jgi:hypothetical protein
MGHLLARARNLNGWKIGFFIAAFLFECAREVAVLEASPPVPNTSGRLFVTDSNQYVSAEGEWLRTDEGEPFLRKPVAIECRKSRGVCILSDAQVLGGRMMPPMITILDAEFSDDIIRFQDSMPLCVTYKYEIDLKSDTITFERSAKDKRSTPIHNFGEPCGDVEKVVRAHFVGSSELKSESSSNLSNHFVPILSAIAFIARVIN